MMSQPPRTIKKPERIMRGCPFDTFFVLIWIFTGIIMSASLTGIILEVNMILTIRWYYNLIPEDIRYWSAMFLTFLVLDLFLSFVSLAGILNGYKEKVYYLRYPVILYLLVSSTFNFLIFSQIEMMTNKDNKVVKAAMMKHLGNYSDRFWDNLHIEFKCCGIDGYQDWKSQVPKSCCQGVDHLDLKKGSEIRRYSFDSATPAVTHEHLQYLDKKSGTDLRKLSIDFVSAEEVTYYQAYKPGSDISHQYSFGLATSVATFEDTSYKKVNKSGNNSKHRYFNLSAANHTLEEVTFSQNKISSTNVENYSYLPTTDGIHQDVVYFKNNNSILGVRKFFFNLDTNTSTIEDKTFCQDGNCPTRSTKIILSVSEVTSNLNVTERNVVNNYNRTQRVFSQEPSSKENDHPYDLGVHGNGKGGLPHESNEIFMSCDLKDMYKTGCLRSLVNHLFRNNLIIMISFLVISIFQVLLLLNVIVLACVPNGG